MLQRSFRIVCGEIVTHEANHICAFYNDDKYIEFYKFNLDRSGSIVTVQGFLKSRLKVPLDYSISSIEYSEQYLVVHCICPGNYSKDRLMFYSFEMYNKFKNPFPVYSIPAAPLYDDLDRKVLFSFTSPNKIILRRGNTSITEYELGEVKVRINSFDNSRLSELFIEVKDGVETRKMDVNTLIMSKQEYMKSQDLSKLKVESSMIFVFLGLPLICVIYLAVVTQCGELGVGDVENRKITLYGSVLGVDPMMLSRNSTKINPIDESVIEYEEAGFEMKDAESVPN